MSGREAHNNDTITKFKLIFAYRKNICPPGLRYLKIFVATASILSGCIADNTNIAVTISKINKISIADFKTNIK